MPSFGKSVPLMRSFVPRLYQNLFTCRQCLQNQLPYSRQFSRRASGPARIIFEAPVNRTSGFSSKITKLLLQRNASTNSAITPGPNATSKTKGAYPDVSDKNVAYWLLASAASVFGIVVFGGLTRLTESGYGLNILS